MIERKNPLLDTFKDVESGGEGVDTAIRKLDKEFDNVIEGANDTDKRLGELKEAFDEAGKINPDDFAKKGDIPLIAAGSGINIEVNGRENKISANIPIASSDNPDPGLISQTDIELLDSLRDTGATVSNHVNNVNIHVPEANQGSDVDKVLKVSQEGIPVWSKETETAWGKIEGNISSQADLKNALDGKALKDHNHEINNVNGLDIALDGKASKVHGHKIADTDGLQVALASKANTEHKHEIAQVNNLSETLETISQNVESNRIALGDVDEKAEAANTVADQAKDAANEAKEKADSAVQGIVAGDNITIISQGNNTFKISSTGTGGGGTTEPAEWGKIGGILADQLDLKEALDGKAAANHTHGIATIEGLEVALNGKAAKEHEHTISNVTGLQDALNKKSDTSHNHAISGITGLQGTLNNMTEATNEAATIAGEAATTAGEAKEAAEKALNSAILGVKVTGVTAGSSAGVVVNNPGTYSVTIGGGASAGAANTSNNVVIGTNSVTSGSRTIAIGRGSQVKSGANDTVAIGYLAMAESNVRESVVIGANAKTQGLQQVVIGYGALAGGAGQGSSGAIAIGYMASALGNRSVAIGASTSKANVVAVSSDDVPEFYRRVVNMADGIDPNDAVTKQQLDLVSGLKCVANKIVPTLKWGEEKLASINIPMTAAKFSQYVVLATGMMQAGGVQTELPIDAVYRNVQTPNGNQLVALSTTTTFITSDPEMEVAVFGYSTPKSEVYVFYNGSFMSVETLEQAGGSLRITFKVFDTGVPITAN